MYLSSDKLPMMIKSHYLLRISFFLMFVISACSSDPDNDQVCPLISDDEGAVEIRINNNSNFDFSDVIVDTGGGRHSFCSVNAGESSFYRSFQKAYRYAFVELTIDGTVFTLQPIDYVGETLLRNGKYTYVLDASDQVDRFSRLTISLQED